MADRIASRGVLAGDDGEIVLCEAQVRWVRVDPTFRPVGRLPPLAADGWKLQQLFSVGIYENGKMGACRTEWRDVPMVEEE